MNKTLNDSDKIDLIIFLKLLWEKKISISISLLLISILSIFYALSIDDVYTSKAVLAPNNHSESMSSSLGSYSPFANIAGFNFASSNISKHQEAMNRMHSFDFFLNGFLPFIKLENLMAIEKWDRKSNTLYYKEKIFNSDKNEWVRKVKYPQKTIPSAQEAYEVYKRNFEANLDRNSGFIILEFNHPSPHIAKKWLDILIKNINEKMRVVDIEASKTAIGFLNQQAQSNLLSEIDEAISQLLEAQMETLMLASVNEDYVFRIIDSPIVQEQRSSPNRVLICIIGFIIGFIFIISFYFFQYIQAKESYN